MKTITEIRETPRVLVLREGPDGGWAEAHLSSSAKPHPAMVVFSWGGGWDHVSASFANRTPTWEEMCEIKRMFFRPNEVCVQLHPLESEYVNNHPYTLHIWRPKAGTVPTPPAWMVGAKKGQTPVDAYKEGVEALHKEGASLC
jgi:hypothetical protein